ncbi:MAG TPA: DUF3667 domain-containing protein [Flavitalea sp.]|nr:DUF3667 domain-containing protein [Flavitalea sp.]
MQIATNPDHHCKNCGALFSGQYCNQCGQKEAHRLDTPHVLHEVLHVFTHADKGIFSLVPGILLRPGLVALDYVNGKRKRHFNVFQYLILIVGFVTFIIAKTHLMEQMMEVMNPDSAKSTRVLAVQKKLLGFTQQYMNFILFALIPVLAFFSWRFFKKKGYNYAENVVLQVLIQAQINTFTLLIIIPLALLGAKAKSLYFLLSIILLAFCNTIANRQFFKVSWPTAFFKGLLVYLGMNLVQIIIIIIVMLVIISNKWY